MYLLFFRSDDEFFVQFLSVLKGKRLLSRAIPMFNTVGLKVLPNPNPTQLSESIRSKTKHMFLYTYLLPLVHWIVSICCDWNLKAFLIVCFENCSDIAVQLK